MDGMHEQHRSDFIKSVMLAWSPKSDLYSLFNKRIVVDGLWAKLLPSSRSVFPVIARHFNKGNYSWPGREIIADLSGVAKNHVSVATDDLVKNSLLRITKGKPSARGQRPNVYHATSVPSGSDSLFIFHSIIDGLHWSKLTDAGRNLYVVMRSFGFIEYEHVIDLTQECIDGLDDDVDDNDDDRLCLQCIQEDAAEDFRKRIYAVRPFELCVADDDLLKELSGIKDHRTYEKAVDNLVENGFIWSLGDFVDGDHTWAVAVRNVFPVEAVRSAA